MRAEALSCPSWGCAPGLGRGCLFKLHELPRGLGWPVPPTPSASTLADLASPRALPLAGPPFCPGHTHLVPRRGQPRDGLRLSAP